MKLPINKLTTFNLHNKRILLRADLNVPLANNRIIDDFRLRALQPTLDFLHKQNAIVFIATHIGRPKGNFDPKLSTQILLPWFKNHKYEVQFQPDLKIAAHQGYEPGSFILLENLRFFRGEQNSDPAFARELAACGEFYVNDAFGALHRNDTSLTLTADCFAADKKTIGFLVEKELQSLTHLITAPEHPFMCIIGGGKVKTKLMLLKKLLGHADCILLCPALVFTFLKVLNKQVGKSLVDASLYTEAQNIMDYAHDNKKHLIFPLDYCSAQASINGPLHIITPESFSKDDIGISIGPQTLQAWKPYLDQAKTIFVNAAMGFQDRPETLEGLEQLLQYLAQCSSYRVIGGGDTVAVVNHLGLTDHFDFISSGGGATIAYLSGQPLPGLQHMM